MSTVIDYDVEAAAGGIDKLLEEVDVGLGACVDLDVGHVLKELAMGFRDREEEKYLSPFLNARFVVLDVV